MPDYDLYQSPFTWRYASPEMRGIWSEHHKRLLWRRIWVALAKTQQGFGLVSAEQLADIEAHVSDIDVPRALDIEAEIHHDLMAELKTFAEQCPTGGGILHMGATSMDIEDNADALRMREALDCVLGRLKELLLAFAEKIEQTADLPVIAFTHIQPAEPSTLGYRLASYAQDLLEDWLRLSTQYAQLRGKGFKGAVGTAAAYADLIGLDALEAFEARLSQLLDLPFYPVATQTYPRKQDYEVISALAGLGGSVYKLAFDLRLLQSPPIGELSEPFAKKQVGSSAMPFKRNPINAEKMDSLARALAVMPQVAWGNAAHSLLERTLDDSANRRSMLPEAFLITDELLRTALRVVKGLNIREESIQKNLDAYAPFAATERLMMAAVKKGADRQAMHERLREHALAAWQAVQQGAANPLLERIKEDALFQQMLTDAEMESLFDVSAYVGSAPQRARELARRIHNLLD
ncbi:adenylosuccinate lyase [Ornatilinea apprima]|uniref:Adenylosuccinate lyase n=1 Tax=Ornatilinea apprima TaxID=1134406 RepID=A0A0P6X9I1_9CHLR|nr:adenylosuccinate lyase [Ornatilinea apprima]KPL78734.1 adenylosuccinate lyase [Ornatilinea apprima]